MGKSLKGLQAGEAVGVSEPLPPTRLMALGPRHLWGWHPQGAQSPSRRLVSTFPTVFLPLGSSTRPGASLLLQSHYPTEMLSCTVPSLIVTTGKNESAETGRYYQ